VTEPQPASALEFRLTDRQRRRSARGLVGLAAIVWSVGLVRLAVTHRLEDTGGWLGLAVLALVLGVVVQLLRRVRPVVVLDADAAHWRWGPRRASIPWSEVEEIEVRERGTARRVVLAGPGGRMVLPVPLTGGSLVGPGPDPALDEKVEIIRRWWGERRSS
jgi:hypothetical protein